MLNGWGMLLQIFCVFFVVAFGFGQEQSDSHIITVTKEIDVAKLNENVEDLNGSVQTLTETISKLDKTVSNLNTTVGDLKVTVARIDERTNGIAAWQYVILAGIFGPLLLSIYDRYKKNDENTTTSINTGRVSQSQVPANQVAQENLNRGTPTQAGQVNEAEMPSTKPTQLMDFPGGDDLRDHLKSDYHATGKKV